MKAELKALKRLNLEELQKKKKNRAKELGVVETMKELGKS